MKRRRRERLSLDQRNCARDPLQLQQPFRNGIEVGQRRTNRLHQHVTVEAENLVEQLEAEAVHHRHDNDQRCNAEHDADERKSRDDRNEPFLAARTQIAPRKHPFVTRERRRSALRSHDPS
jgi:hypothetical protein